MKSANEWALFPLTLDELELKFEDLAMDMGMSVEYAKSYAADPPTCADGGQVALLIELWAEITRLQAI